MIDLHRWRRVIEGERREKDRFFGTHWQSPIEPEDRAEFEGLRYYPPDPHYRFEASLHEHADKKVLQIQDTAGNIRNFLRWGEFHFKVGDKECRLQAYKTSPREDQLFVPFKDSTSGKETYGAGRYLDLHHDGDRTPDGKWILDFNRAYNPWCAYSEHYACPFVPPENTLEVHIRAGEKNYPSKKG
ncbi:MAG: DUF1684 domain-containing protein [Deltaproteobacteria bacterium]|nr:DUF1684 domain-containing protein [Deltaproteobacteria bacterium]